MPMTLDINQYTGKPLGRLMVKKANMKGIIHRSMRLVDACRGSATAGVLIFWSTHMEMPTITAMTGVGSGKARSSHRKLLFRGTTSWAMGSQE